MDITKYKANEVYHYIKHNLRDLPLGKSASNKAIVPELSSKNYSLVDRGETAAEVNRYRKQFERGVWKYNRKTLNHAVGICLQCPADCPEEQKDDFFKVAYDYFCSLSPAGEEGVILAQVHKDERVYLDEKLISHDHLHFFFVPVIPDTDHEGYEYRMNADAYTKRRQLSQYHHELQRRLDENGIRATVVRKKEGSGRNIRLTVDQLKTITKETGLTIDKSMTAESLAELLSGYITENMELKKMVGELSEKNRELRAQLVGQKEFML